MAAFFRKYWIVFVASYALLTIGIWRYRSERTTGITVSSTTSRPVDMERFVKMEDLYRQMVALRIFRSELPLPGNKSACIVTVGSGFFSLPFDDKQKACMVVSSLPDSARSFAAVRLEDEMTGKEVGSFFNGMGLTMK